MLAVPAVATRVASRSVHGPQPAASASPPGADVAVRLVALVRAGAPLRRALAAIVGQLVAKRAWERLGFARPRDYAAERAGISARQLQELAHVDAALAELPKIEAALTAGSLSWTKARLLCRVATREDEALWLAAAHTPEAGTVEEIQSARYAGMADAFRLSAALGLAMGVYCFFLPHTPPQKGERRSAY